MLWSKTKEMVHDFTKKKDCFITLEDTVLGFVLDGLTWCGKEGSSGKTLQAKNKGFKCILPLLYVPLVLVCMILQPVRYNC